jgi:hypothetical protein
MSIKQAMEDYFHRQADAYLMAYGQLPSIPYQHGTQTLIYKDRCDDDDYIQWTPVHAKDIHMKQLCPTLTQFYSSYYYGEITGHIGDISYEFPGIYNYPSAIHQIEWGIMHGRELLPDENNVTIAVCRNNKNDELILMYNQDNNRLFIWDSEYNDKTFLPYSLEEFIRHLEI